MASVCPKTLDSRCKFLVIFTLNVLDFVYYVSKEKLLAIFFLKLLMTFIIFSEIERKRTTRFVTYFSHRMFFYFAKLAELLLRKVRYKGCHLISFYVTNFRANFTKAEILGYTSALYCYKTTQKTISHSDFYEVAMTSHCIMKFLKLLIYSGL